MARVTFLGQNQHFSATSVERNDKKGIRDQAVQRPKSGFNSEIKLSDCVSNSHWCAFHDIAHR